MKLNLDTLRREIQEDLESRGIIIFNSFPRSSDAASPVYWDTENFPDFGAFLNAAEAVGVRLVTLYARSFDEDLVDEAMDELAAASIDRDERRAIDARLKEMRAYTGFTCQIELSFDLASRVYIFDLRTDWFEELNDLLDRIDESGIPDHPGDEPPLAGYYSKN